MTEEAPLAAITVSGLVKRYGGRAVVDDVSFAVARGEVFALLGPNGAGKTTTLEILEGYRTADGGAVSVLGLDPRLDGRTLKPRIGIMLQQGGLFPQITPREALSLFAAFYSNSEDPQHMLEMVGLGSVGRTRFRRLSGGERQRLNLALALIGRPELVFLDEPTAAMDPQARRSTWQLLRDLREQGCTVVLTTHFIDEAEHLADRVAIIDRGRLVALGSPALLRQTAEREIRFSTSPPVTIEQVAVALACSPATLENVDGAIVARLEPSPALIARLTAWFASEDILLVELRTGSRSLEQAFLAITADSSPAK